MIEVFTETAVHVIDEVEMTVTRYPAESYIGDREAVEIANLRRDYEPVPMLDIPRIQVGHPVVFLLDVRGDDVSTIRTTTLVRKVVCDSITELQTVLTKKAVDMI